MPSFSSLAFRIGVTGHRDPDPVYTDRIHTQIRETLSEIRDQLGAVNVTVVSALAAGADQWVANIALEMGLTVEAIIPMPYDDYVMDFDESDLLVMEELLAHPNTHRSELSRIASVDGELTAKGRDAQYLKLAEVLQQRSHLMLALWDGQQTYLEGGTANVIQHFLQPDDHRIEETLEFLEVTDCELPESVVWIPTPRLSGSSEDLSEDVTWLSGGLGGKMLGLTLTMTSGCRSYLQAIARYHSCVDEQLNADDNQSNGITHEDFSHGVLRAIDTLALDRQRKSNYLFKGFAMMTAVMGTLFLLYAKILATPWFLVAYLGIFFGGWLVFRKAHQHRWFQDYLLYRATAECLRTESALGEAGVGAELKAQSILRRIGIQQMEGFNWIQALLVSLTQLKPDVAVSDTAAESAPAPERGRLWVDEQVAYFKRKQHQLNHEHHRLHRISKGILFALTIGVIALIFFKKQMLGIELTSGAHPISLKTLLILTLELLPFWLGVWELYQNKLATRELAWQYRHQLGYFERASKRLKQTIPQSHHRETLTDLGEQSVTETCLWCVQRYHREFTPPTAG